MQCCHYSFEDEYFATRYVGHNKPVLHDWNVTWKQKVLTKILDELKQETIRNVDDWRTDGVVYSTDTDSAMTSILYIAAYRNLMNNAWYDGLGATGNRKSKANVSDSRNG